MESGEPEGDCVTVYEYISGCIMDRRLYLPTTLWSIVSIVSIGTHSTGLVGERRKSEMGYQVVLFFYLKEKE